MMAHIKLGMTLILISCVACVTMSVSARYRAADKETKMGAERRIWPMTRFSPVKCAFDGIKICIETHTTPRSVTNRSKLVLGDEKRRRFAPWDQPRIRST